MSYPELTPKEYVSLHSPLHTLDLYGVWAIIGQSCRAWNVDSHILKFVTGTWKEAVDHASKSIVARRAARIYGCYVDGKFVPSTPVDVQHVGIVPAYYSQAMAQHRIRHAPREFEIIDPSTKVEWLSKPHGAVKTVELLNEVEAYNEQIDALLEQVEKLRILQMGVTNMIDAAMAEGLGKLSEYHPSKPKFSE